MERCRERRPARARQAVARRSPSAPGRARHDTPPRRLAACPTVSGAHPHRRRLHWRRTSRGARPCPDTERHEGLVPVRRVPRERARIPRATSRRATAACAPAGADRSRWGWRSLASGSRSKVPSSVISRPRSPSAPGCDTCGSALWFTYTAGAGRGIPRAEPRIVRERLRREADAGRVQRPLPERVRVGGRSRAGRSGGLRSVEPPSGLTEVHDGRKVAWTPELHVRARRPPRPHNARRPPPLVPRDVRKR